MPTRTHERHIVVTGSKGFIGRNLLLGLAERGHRDIRTFDRSDKPTLLSELLQWADVVVHLAGVNRPQSDEAFTTDNVDLTRRIVEGLGKRDRSPHVIYTSSIQALRSTAYGLSKQEAEKALMRLHEETGAAISIFRLPNIFGKWSRPHYNSVVATFCRAAALGQPMPIDEPTAPLDLVYIDDLVQTLCETVEATPVGIDWPAVSPVYSSSVGEVAAIISGFASGRIESCVDRVGQGLPRALYATYLTHLAPDQFSYRLDDHKDARGTFVEVIKTPDCGQVSFFSSAPGVIRGRHYHHTKSEKFVVVHGNALFRFRSLQDGNYFECSASAAAPRVVQTIPGWSHEIVNSGDDDLVVLVWANEVFDEQQPDTYRSEIG